MAGKVTAGHDALGEFAPKFAQLNDDVLFGEVWSREDKLSRRDRSLITVTALMSMGITDSSLKFHLMEAKKNGISRTEIAEALTHLAFYNGWPKAWAVFRMAKEVWTEAENDVPRDIFPLGKKNDAFAKYFIGQSYLAPVSTVGTPVFNVTFEPGCRNNWHVHHATQGGGQVLMCTMGRGWYQEWGKEPRLLLPGDVVEIPANVKHWHGAAADSWFAHLAMEVPGENCANEWGEPVDDEQYSKLPR